MTTKIPVELSSTPGIVDNSDATAITITSDEKVGIGTTSPSAQVQINGDGELLRFDGTGGAARSIRFRGLSTSTPAFITVDGSFKLHCEDSGTHMEFHTANAERMRIDSSGNIGIGTTNGDVANDGVAARTYVGIIGSSNRGVLNIGSTAASGADGGKISFVNGANAIADIYADADSGSQTNGFLQFVTAQTARMRIDSSGNVGISMIPISGSKLSIHSDQNGGAYIEDVGNSYPAITTRPDANNNYFPMYILNGAGGANGYILSNSSGTTFSQSGSDLSFKENIKDWNENVLDSFKNIKPSTFTYKSDENKKEIKGYIAQNEVDKFPEAYSINPKDGKYWFNPSGMIVYLMKAIQEQQAIIEDLQTQINEVKNGN